MGNIVDGSGMPHCSYCSVPNIPGSLQQGLASWTAQVGMICQGSGTNARRASPSMTHVTASASNLRKLHIQLHGNQGHCHERGTLAKDSATANLTNKPLPAEVPLTACKTQALPYKRLQSHRTQFKTTTPHARDYCGGGVCCGFSLNFGNFNRIFLPPPAVAADPLGPPPAVPAEFVPPPW